MAHHSAATRNNPPRPKRKAAPNRLTGLLYCSDCGAKLTHRYNLVQGKRIDIYLNFIGAFEVPAHIVTPMEAEEQRRRQEEQAAKKARSQELAKAREEKRKQKNREFTARKKAGLLTPEEQEAEEKRLAHNRAWQKEWREKRKAA